MGEQALRKLKPPPMRQRTVRFDEATEDFLTRRILRREQALFIRIAVEEKIKAISDGNGRSRQQKKRSKG